LIGKTKMAYGYTFALSHFCFSLSSFSSQSLDHHHMWPSPSLDCHLAPPLGVYHPISHITFRAKVSTLMFHQLSKTKLGLSPPLGGVDEWAMEPFNRRVGEVHSPPSQESGRYGLKPFEQADSAASPY
jgi:hypothetical protein